MYIASRICEGLDKTTSNCQQKVYNNFQIYYISWRSTTLTTTSHISSFYVKKGVQQASLTWKRSTDIDIFEFLDGLPELDQRGHRLPHHHRAVVRPAGVKGEIVEGSVVDSFPEEGPLQRTGHQLLLK